MGIRKADVTKFISDKSRARKDILWKAAHGIVQAAVKPVIFEIYKDVGPIERQASKLYDTLQEAKGNHKRFKDWHNLNRLMQDLNSHIVTLRMDITREHISSVMHNLLNDSSYPLVKELDTIIPELKKQLVKTISEYQELTKLTNELITIVEASHNGDKAYKRLEELGVDLSGFNASGKNLPAIIKLSGNVCLLNGDC
ncbi:hypothetical protein [Paenibacillus agricola]|uniref:Uncharacterized protein n=1 Tax=Paenibacillus agricola TaxID=2716264 RepID=A0ABX0JAK7_9BACL|nr:hypothetical protein [Paenibacillus agricola]NHN33517.1 hypothetical protein [Paenibacillus agricola]